MSNRERIVTGQKYRILSDYTNKIWDRISFWTKAADIEFNDGSNLENYASGVNSSLSSLSSRITTNTNNISGLSSTVSSLSSTVSGHTSSISSLSSSISSLSSTVSSLSSTVSGNTSSINTMQGSISSLAQRLDTDEGTISGLQTGLGLLASKLNGFTLIKTSSLPGDAGSHPDVIYFIPK